MAISRLSAVVFDCDGVLIESNAVKSDAFGQTVKEYGQEAMDRLMDYHRENGGISRYKKFEWFYSEVIDTPMSEEIMASLCDRFTQLCIDAVLEAPMVAGAIESLDLLSGKAPLFVASGTPQKELRQILQEKGLSRYFKEIRGTPPEKQFLLEQIIVQNQFDPSEVLMVGDAETDLEAAVCCGTLFYGRGERFAERDLPWSKDLQGLVEYLKTNFNLD